MTEKEKKQQEEKISFEALQRHLTDLEFIKVMDMSGESGAPDILAKFNGSKIAIEVTSVDRDHSRMAKASHQDRLIEETFAILRDEIPLTDGMVLNVLIYWSAHHATISRSKIPKYARHLASWIKQRLPNPIPMGFILDGPPDWDASDPASLHEWISDLRIATYEVKDLPGGFPDDSHVEVCSAGGSACRASVSIDEIMNAIREKAGKLHRYRDVFKEGPVWLLLHCSFTDFRMPLDFPESRLEIPCDHGFDQIFLVDHQSNRMIEVLQTNSESP